MQTDRLVNGVFQGGGAKAIAYAGALRALAERDVWFGSVAGASAGAITASLIAAGLDAAKLESMIPSALVAAQSPIPRRLGLAALGRTTSVYEGTRLRRWLDDTFARSIGHDPALGPVTFAQLHAATRIELYVVALDLATGLPQVFSRRSTPTVDVAGAVMASSAIPGAFPAGRVVLSTPDQGLRVHQLIDGAGWANYPAFVFEDDAFRCWLRGEARHDRPWTADDEASWEAETSRPVVGMVFGEPDPLEPFDPVTCVPLDGPTIDRRFDLGPARTSSGRLGHVSGALLSSDWARLALALALVIWATLSISTMPVALRRFSTWLAGWVPDPLFPVVLVASLAVALLAIVVTMALIAGLLTVSRLLADTLLPGARRLLGATMEAPPWIGLGADSVVIRVPRRGLKTTRFKVDDDTRRRAIETAAEDVGRQLDGSSGRRLEAMLGGATWVPVEHDPTASTQPEEPDRPGPEANPAVPVVVIVILTTIVSGLAWWATNSAGAAAIWQIAIAVAVAVAAATVASRYVGDRTRQRAHARAREGVTATAPPAPRVAPWLLTAVGGVLVIGGLAVSFLAMDDRAEDTVTAEVVAATEITADLNEYRMRTDDGDPIEIRSARHLRLGERAFVTTDASGAAVLTGPLDDRRFGVSVALVVLGIGTITFGVHTRRWVVRNRRLRAIANTAN